jgi:hypothetical protein
MRWLSLLLLPSVLLAGGFTIGGGSGSVTVGGASGSIETDGYYEKIPIYYTAGQVNFSATGGGSVTWHFWDGTTSTATSFDSTFAADGVVYLETDLTDGSLEITDGATDARFVGDLSVFRRLTYYLNLYNCSNVTGDLSDVADVTYYLNLTNCSNVTGDLSDVSGVTSALNLTNCSNVTGDLSDVSGVTSALNLTNCSNVTGDLSDVSGVTYYLRLYNCSNVTGVLDPHPDLSYVDITNTATSPEQVSQSLVNLWNNTSFPGGYQRVDAQHISVGDLTPAGAAAKDSLVANGWTINLGV